MKVYFAEHRRVKNLNGIVLTQDHVGGYHSQPWNDFGYYIKFKVYYVESEEVVELGFSKILVNGFENTSVYFKDLGEKVDSGIFNITSILNPSNSLSVPEKIDFYRKLNKLFGRNELVLDDFLMGICDASIYCRDVCEQREWDGFTALLRDSEISEAKMRKGYQIARGRYEPKPTFTFDIESEVKTFEPIRFYFDRARKLGKTNINILIGENGVGKTHLLECAVNTLVGLQPSNNSYPYFHKVIVAAYSPFEKFHTASQLAQKIIDKDDHRNPSDMLVDEYAYIGFKDDQDKFNVDWPKVHSVNSLLKVIKFDIENNWWRGVPNLTRLIETLQLSIDFNTMAIPCKDSQEIISISVDDKFDDDWILEVESKFDPSFGILFYKDSKRVLLSSGQEIFSYLLPAIMAEIEDESLIILDEPETYLHPTLEVALLDMLKKLLSETDSSAIIATHSAIIAREVEKKAVTILQKNDGITQAIKPSIETYGASLEVILGSAFNDYNIIKPYQSALDVLLDDKSQVEDLLKEFVKDLGDDGLVYAASKLMPETSIEILGEE